MSLGRYVVDAVLVEGRSPSELAKQHGISRSWIYALVARFREGGYEALKPRSRRPRSCSHQVDAETQATILRLRAGLISAGLDAGACTIAHHLLPLSTSRPPSAPSGPSSSAKAWSSPRLTSARPPRFFASRPRFLTRLG